MTLVGADCIYAVDGQEAWTGGRCAKGVATVCSGGGRVIPRGAWLAVGVVEWRRRQERKRMQWGKDGDAGSRDVRVLRGGDPNSAKPPSLVLVCRETDVWTSPRADAWFFCNTWFFYILIFWENPILFGKIKKFSKSKHFLKQKIIKKKKKKRLLNKIKREAKDCWIKLNRKPVKKKPKKEKKNYEKREETRISGLNNFIS